VTFAYDVLDGRIQTEACEINVVHHCNLSCRSCSHLSPIFRREVVDPDAVYRDLSCLAPHYEPTHVRLLGGEPLLHPALDAVAEAARASGISDRIRVITNGTVFARLRPAIWEQIDELHVSLYPGHEVDADEQARVNAEAAAHGVDVTWKRFGYFRESYSEVGTDDRELVSAIYTTCQIAHRWRCHNVVDGAFYKCPQAYFVGRTLAGAEHARDDGVELVDSPLLGEELLRYLTEEEPLRACRNCLGSVGRLFRHEQDRRDGFRLRQDLPTEELLDRAQLALLQREPDASNACVTDRYFATV
jgi:organic radical activating enzyme